MGRFAAFLRGVYPNKPPMDALRKCFEGAGFTDVKTVLASGNVIFSARAGNEPAIERKCESAMKKSFGKSFFPIVRSIDSLEALLASDPYKPFRLGSDAKRVVTFLREPPQKLSPPIEQDGARILCVKGREVFTSYVRTPRGPVFMVLIAKTLGEEVTTRTWDTIARVCKAAS